MALKCAPLSDAAPTVGGYTGILCAVTLQALQDVTDCNGYSHGVDALCYLNSEPVQDLHEMIGIHLRRRWTFAEAKALRERLKRKVSNELRNQGDQGARQQRRAVRGA